MIDLFWWHAEGAVLKLEILGNNVTQGIEQIKERVAHIKEKIELQLDQG